MTFVTAAIQSSRRTAGKMKPIARKIIFIMILVGLSTSVSGCAYSLANCNDYSGTAKYDECLASQGDKELQYQLGRSAYEEGNMDEAIKWLKKAAKKRREYMTIYTGSDVAETLETGNYEPGHKEAIKLLIDIHEKGLGVNVDHKRAEFYRKKS